MKSDKHLKAIRERVILGRVLPLIKKYDHPEKFSVRYSTRSDTQQIKVTLKAASVKSKAPISLPKMPWDAK